MKPKSKLYKLSLLLFFLTSITCNVICQEPQDSTSSFGLRDQQIRLNLFWPGASYEKRINSSSSFNLQLFIIPDSYIPFLSVRKYMNREERFIAGKNMKNNTGYYLGVANAWFFEYYGDALGRILETEDGLQAIKIAPVIGIQSDIAYNFSVDLFIGPSIDFERKDWSKIESGLIASLAFGYVF